MFYDRANELRTLLWHHDRAKERNQLVVVYGRRRIGKTALARRFIEERDGIYLFIEPKSEELVFRDAENAFGYRTGTRPRIDCWTDLFSLARDRGLPLVLDEFQNLGSVNSAAYSTIQRVWDEMASETGLMVVLIGSYVGMVKRTFRDSRQPLFGRATGMIRLLPLDARTSIGMLMDRGMGFEEALESYSIFGGVPRYLLEISPGIENLSRLLFGPSALLREEGTNIMALEFGSLHKGYFSVLESISKGKRTPKEISDVSGMPIATVSKYLGELSEEYELVKGELPLTSENKRLVRYRLTDNFVDYWFRFVHSRSSLIEIDAERALRSAREELPIVVSRRMEDIVIQLLLRKKDIISPSEIGRWWDRTGEEIDVLSIDQGSSKVLFCEVKWKTSRTGCDAVRELKRKADLVQWRKDTREESFLLVSRAGFTKSCLDLMDREGVHHWDLSELKRRSLDPT